MPKFLYSLFVMVLVALFAAVGGFAAVSLSSGDVDADRGAMNPAVPMMSWAEVSAMANASSSDLATTTITPVRIVDTREGSASLGGSKIPWGPLETRLVEAAGLGTIPEGAVGVVVNVTALNASAPDTYLTLFPTGDQMPNASTLNPVPDQVAFNAATVLLGEGGTFSVYNYSGSVDVIIDVTAYMTRSLAEAVDDVGADVDELKSYTAVLVDAEGSTFPMFGERVRVNGGWHYVNDRNGVTPTDPIYYLSDDCSGTPYGGSEEKERYGRYLNELLLVLTPTAYINDEGTLGLVTYGETHPTLTVGDMGSARSYGTPQCSTTFYGAGSAVTEISVTPLEGLPVAPVSMTVYAE